MSTMLMLGLRTFLARVERVLLRSFDAGRVSQSGMNELVKYMVGRQPMYKFR